MDTKRKQGKSTSVRLWEDQEERIARELAGNKRLVSPLLRLAVDTVFGKVDNGWLFTRTLDGELILIPPAEPSADARVAEEKGREDAAEAVCGHRRRASITR